MVTPNGIIESQIISFYSPINGECYAVISTVSSVRCQIACEIAGGGCGCGMSASPTIALYEVKGAYLIDQGDYNPGKINMILNKLGFGPIGIPENNIIQQRRLPGMPSGYQPGNM